MSQRNIALTLTAAGYQALISAKQNGLDVQFTAIALGSGMTPLDSEATALTSPKEEQPIFSSIEPAPGQLTMSALFNVDPAAQYAVTELALIGDGVTFGVWSTEDPTQAIVVRTPGVPYTATLTVAFTELPSQNVTVVTQPLDAAAQVIAQDAVDTGITAHIESADPHPQYGFRLTNPNLLVNGSAEIGAFGWSSLGQFNALVDTVGGLGSYFGVTAALASYNNVASSLPVAIGAAEPVTLSCDVDASAITAGELQLELTAYDSAENALGQLCQITATNGEALTRYTATGITPASTASVGVQIVAGGVSAPANGVTVRRIKLERSAGPSAYSREADQLALALGVPLINAFVAAATAPNHAVNLGQLTSILTQALYGIAGPMYVNANAQLMPGTYLVDTSAGSFTLQLPTNPSKGNGITFTDANATWGTQTWTLAANGKTIMGQAADLVVNVSDQEFTIWFNGSDWRLV